MKTRISLIALLLFAVTGFANSQEDVGKQIDQAKSKFFAAEQEFADSIADWLDAQERRARSRGDRGTVLDVQAKRNAFTKSGTLPSDAPRLALRKWESSKRRLESDFRSVVSKLTRLGRDKDAENIEKELEKILSGELEAVAPKDAVALNGRFFKVFPDALSWTGASAKCTELGGRLAVITSEEENKFVLELAKKQKALDSVWIGATDQHQEGTWIGSDGKPIRWEKWGPGQPNNKKLEEHFALLIVRFGNKNLISTWSDQPESATQHKPGFVCEWPR